MKSKANSKIKYGSVEVGNLPFEPKATKIKITAWLDADVLLALKEQAGKTGKYQTLMNQLLRDAISKKSTLEKRIEKIEKTLKIKAS